MSARQPIDPTWWDTEHVDGVPLRHALAERDIKSVFQFLHRRGWSWGAVAQATDIGEQRVREIANGKRRVENYDVYVRVAVGLSIPREYLGVGITPVGEKAATGSEPYTIPMSEHGFAVDVRRSLPVDAGAARGHVAMASAHVGDVGQFVGWSIEQSADEALLFAARAASRLDPQTTSDLFEQVKYVARDYADQHRWHTFSHARRVRDIAFELSTRVRRPDDLADIYLIASLSSLLMSSATFDLGRPKAALGLAQAARSLSGLSKHAEAQAWSAGLHATLLNWQGRPGDALGQIEQALQTPASSTEVHRLHHIAARSHALRGDRRATEHALAEAMRKEGSIDDGGLLQHEIGGEFRFDRARAAACAGAAWLHLGDGPAAKQCLRAALESYEALPATQRPWAPINGARVDLATAFMLAGELDGADEAIEPIFGLPEAQRISTIAGRLSAARSQLRKPHNKRNAVARQLDDRIAEWVLHQPNAISES